MTTDNLVPLLIVAIVVISSIVSGLKKAKQGFDTVVERQRTAEPQRIAALEAEMARRGVTPPPAIQRLLAAFDSAAAAKAQPPGPAAPAVQAQYAPQPQYAPQQYTAQQYTAQPQYVPQGKPQPQPQPHGRHRQRPPHQDQPPEAAVRVPGPVARTVDVPATPVPAATPRATRGMLAGAFADPAHARDAVILMEVLAPPVALRR